MTPGTYDITVQRNAPYLPDTFDFEGYDFSAATFELEVRAYRGTEYAAEPTPALAHMTSDAWVFIGWQATSDGSGVYEPPPTPPPGWGDDRPSEMFLSPLATADLPTSSTGLSAGEIYLSAGLPVAVIAEVSGTFAKILTSAAGAATVTATQLAVPAGVYLDITMYLSGGTLDADATLTGTLTLTEETSGGNTVFGTYPVSATSSGLDLGGGVYAVDTHTTVAVSGMAARSGDVTYRIDFVRTGGPNFVAGAVINGVVKITPTV